MITEQTYEKMKKMRMNHLAQSIQDMGETDIYDDLTFEERLGLLIDTEWDHRQNTKAKNLNKKAGFTQAGACIEAIEYRPERNLDKTKVFKLSTGDYIKARQDVVILGQCGVGKSFLAQALGNAACRKHQPTRYVGLQDVFDDLSIADAAGTLSETFDDFIKPKLLIIDDAFLMQPSVTDAARLLKLVEKRMHVGSTIYCTQLPPEEWHKRIDEKIVADAILDRIVNRAHIITLKGESLRKKLAPKD
jgi:DNA replication protein DnaC